VIGRRKRRGEGEEREGIEPNLPALFFVLLLF